MGEEGRLGLRLLSGRCKIGRVGRSRGPVPGLVQRVWNRMMLPVALQGCGEGAGVGAGCWGKSPTGSAAGPSEGDNFQAIRGYKGVKVLRVIWSALAKKNFTALC